MIQMPALFIGHGSPLNIIEPSAWSASLKELAASLPRPAAVLVVSAHWVSPELRVSAAAAPVQMYDFIGFPDSLYKVDYRAPGHPELAHEIAGLLSAAGFPCREDAARGIDHAAWAVLVHMYPGRNVPVLELSLDYRLAYRKWFDVGKALRPLRKKGVLLLGSGNIVHNLYQFTDETDSKPYPWTLAFNSLVKEAVQKKDWGSLASYATPVEASRKAVPTPDHYIPLLAVLGAMDENESARVFHESFQNASIAMTSYIIS
ncbi:MAG: dioxygenase [Spirochaetaceae bacterium]|nr:dioxygenase [Spirochaetaceae bacterium]